ncbi:MAG: hypothetical protein AAGM22_30310, partial [Acidobacteriota bacterium]
MLDLRKTVLALSLAAITAAAPSLGLCGDECTISIRSDAVSVPLPLEGWLYPDFAAVDVTVVDAPIFGTWASEVYTPSEDFLVAGGDRMRFEVKNSGTNEVTRHTVVFNLAPSPLLLYSEDFDQLLSVSDLQNGFVVEGQSSMALVDDPRSAGRELVIDLDAGGADASVRRIDGYPILGDGRDTARIIGVINASPPDEFGDPESVDEFTATVLELGDMAFAQLRYSAAEGYQFRAVAGAGTTCAVGACATLWQDVEAGHDYRVRLSFGRHNVQHPDGSNTYSLEIRYRDLDGSWQHTDEIVGLTLPQNFSLLPLEPSFGAFDLSGTGQTAIHFDDVEASAGFLTVSPLRQRVEAFEDGDWSTDWQTIGMLGSPFRERVATGPGAADNWWGALSFADVLNNGAAQWSDTAPSQSSTLWAHLRLELGRLDMPKWASFQVLEGTDASGLKIVHARIRTDGQQ